MNGNRYELELWPCLCIERKVTTRHPCDSSLSFCATIAVTNEQMCQVLSILDGATPQRVVCKFTAVNITIQNFKNLFEKYIYQSVRPGREADPSPLLLPRSKIE